MRGAFSAFLAFGLPLAAHATSVHSLYSFSGGTDGRTPYGKLVMGQGGLLYGVTVSGGTAQRGNIYSFDPATLNVTNLYSFSGGADGSSPQAGLVLDSHGILYGVTESGGSTAGCDQGCGTLFAFDTAAQKLTTLYTFKGGADGAGPIAPLTLIAGKLYGSTIRDGTDTSCGTGGCGTIFSFTIGSKKFQVQQQLTRDRGVEPDGAMLSAPANLLYGTMSEAGGNGSGTVFTFNRKTRVLSDLHDFDYHVDGSSPQGDIVLRHNVIYGATDVGGPTNSTAGTIYSLDLTTGAVVTLYSFAGGDDGEFPQSGVDAVGAAGLLYGTTVQGGASGAGTVFSINPKNGHYAQIHVFDISDGALPSSPLLATPAGVLYGVTSEGGSGNGTIYMVQP